MLQSSCVFSPPNKRDVNGNSFDPAWIDEATAKQIDYTDHMNIDSRRIRLPVLAVPAE
jgi:hypothetical protein